MDITKQIFADFARQDAKKARIAYNSEIQEVELKIKIKDGKTIKISMDNVLQSFKDFLNDYGAERAAKALILETPATPDL